MGETTLQIRALQAPRGYRWDYQRARGWNHDGQHWDAFLEEKATHRRIGQVGMVVYADHLVLRLILVHRGWRGEKLGSAMLRAVLTAYPDLPIQLKVEPVSEEQIGDVPGLVQRTPLDAAMLHAWYVRHGFEFDVERSAAKSGVWLVRRAYTIVQQHAVGGVEWRRIAPDTA